MRCLPHGLSTEYLAESGYQCERAYRELTEVLTMHPEITAICSISDIVTPAAIRAIHDLGKIPGKDVHIISFDGMPSMHYCIPSISTFIQPRDEMACYIYDLLLGLISDERQHQHITFQTLFFTGESSNVFFSNQNIAIFTLIVIKRQGERKFFLFFSPRFFIIISTFL